jgi:hypothetical protein
VAGGTGVAADMGCRKRKGRDGHGRRASSNPSMEYLNLFIFLLLVTYRLSLISS